MLFSLKLQSDNHQGMIIIMNQVRKRRTFPLYAYNSKKKRKKKRKISRSSLEKMEVSKLRRRRGKFRALGVERRRTRNLERKPHLPEKLTAQTRFSLTQSLLFIEEENPKPLNPLL